MPSGATDIHGCGSALAGWCSTPLSPGRPRGSRSCCCTGSRRPPPAGPGWRRRWPRPVPGAGAQPAGLLAGRSAGGGAGLPDAGACRRRPCPGRGGRGGPVPPGRSRLGRRGRLGPGQPPPGAGGHPDPGVDAAPAGLRGGAADGRAAAALDLHRVLPHPPAARARPGSAGVAGASVPARPQRPGPGVGRALRPRPGRPRRAGGGARLVPRGHPVRHERAQGAGPDPVRVGIGRPGARAAGRDNHWALGRRGPTASTSWKGAGHWLPEHHPEELAELLLEHLAVASARSLTGG